MRSRKRIVGLVLSLLGVALCTGCTSIVLPYHEEPLCRKGVTGGYCASMTEVYDEISKDMKQNKKYRGPQTMCDDPRICVKGERP